MVSLFTLIQLETEENFWLVKWVMMADWEVEQNLEWRNSLKHWRHMYNDSFFCTITLDFWLSCSLTYISNNSKCGYRRDRTEGFEFTHKTIVPANALFIFNRRDGVMVRASASQSIYLGFISLVESYQTTLKMVSTASLLGVQHLK